MQLASLAALGRCCRAKQAAQVQTTGMGSSWVVAWAHNGLVWAPGATTQCPHGPNWPKLAHQSWHATGGGNWVPHWWPRLGFGAAQPPPCSQIKWAPQLVAPNGLATLMAMAQDCAHGLCTSHTMYSVPLGTWVLLEIDTLLTINRGIMAIFESVGWVVWLVL